MLGGQRFAFSLVIITAFCIPSYSQDNSPYSRYGIGDLVPPTSVNMRGMGGISAGFADSWGLTLNYSNPASFGSFQAFREQTSKRLASGRAILDAGINLESRTLREPNEVGKFKASNALFSHLQLGVPLRPNWGLSFGLRPISRVSYKMISSTRIPADSTTTQNEGDGGAYVVSLGTGVKIKTGAGQSLSLGLSGGYLFGKTDYSTRRIFHNDSLFYNPGNHQVKTTYGNVQITGGLQYAFNLKKTKDAIYTMTFGVYGNLKQKLNARKDDIYETYYYDQSVGYVRLDSVSEQLNVKGKIELPASFTTGFVIEKLSLTGKESTWLFGVDFHQANWDDYRVYGKVDSFVRNKWEVRVGAQLRPVPKANYFSNVAYRAGFFIGPDYIQVGNKLPLFGASLGLELPIRNFNRASPYQATRVNLAFEFIKRGNNDNPLKENLFRVSAGFSLSDLWFIKRKYD